MLGWHPGDSQPSIQHLQVDGRERDFRLLGRQDTSIEAVWKKLQLGVVQFADYADGSWFQKKAPWDIQEVSMEENIALQNIAG